MEFCGGFEIASRKFVLFVTLLLSGDIILLSFFSGWLATASGRKHKIFLAGVVITGCLVGVFVYFFKLAFKLKIRKAVKIAINSAKESEVDAEFLASLSGLPTRFSFAELERATSGFQTKLGRGGFGSVYFGTLLDGTEVAVKRLERESHGQKEFCAEVATISRVRHVNLICLKGFCVEGAERLLVYEYMPRGSLDRWIFLEKSEVPPLPNGFLSSCGSVALDWDLRYHIAVETARGLAYLHEECEEAILHLDVKPQNILLDELFHPKVSDFGLSRSMDRELSRVVTTTRGTPGYLAPEWFLGAGIDVKTDVYGYGMLVLELISGRRSVDQAQKDTTNWFLPSMAFQKLKDNLVVDVIDPILQGMLDEKTLNQQVPTIIQVALWCIQENAQKRPSMSSVVLMLEGRMPVEEPPSSHNFLAPCSFKDRPATSITIIDAESLTLPR